MSGGARWTRGVSGRDARGRSAGVSDRREPAEGQSQRAQGLRRPVPEREPVVVAHDEPVAESEHSLDVVHHGTSGAGERVARGPSGGAAFVIGLRLAALFFLAGFFFLAALRAGLLFAAFFFADFFFDFLATRFLDERFLDDFFFAFLEDFFFADFFFAAMV